MRTSFRPLLPNETDWETLSVFVLIPASVAGRLWLHFGMPLPACTFKNFTGCPCPGCGATRAAHALFDGNIVGALSINPLATAGAGTLAAWCVYAIAVKIVGRGKRLRFDNAPRRTSDFILAVGLLAVAANWYWVATRLPESPWCAR